MAKKKRVLVLSDFHCGHKTGLLPPGQHKINSDDKHDKIAIELWKKYIEIIEPLKPIHSVFAVGDLIDGRENSQELTVGNVQHQADLASICLEQTGAKKFVIIKGTPFHVGKHTSNESRIADNVNADLFGIHEYPSINGLVFDLKHKIGSSSVPYGQMTPLAKEALWARLWQDRGQPESRVLIRGHTHKHNFCGDFDYLAMTTPGLQGTSEYGRTNVSRTIDYGVIYFDIWNEKEWIWKSRAIELELVKSEVVAL